MGLVDVGLLQMFYKYCLISFYERLILKCFNFMVFIEFLYVLQMFYMNNSNDGYEY